MKRLKDYTISCASLGYSGIPIAPLPGIDILPLKSVEQLEYYCNKLRPDVTVIFHSFPFIKQVGNLPSTAGKKIVYIPIEGTNLPKDLLSPFYDYDQVIVPSKYSQRILKRQGILANIVPHGVDTEFFTPKKTPWKEFRFGYLGMNDVRKQIPRIMEARSRIKKRSMLVLATTAEGHYNLSALAQTYGISPTFIEKKYIGLPMTNDNIRDFYRTLDVYVSMGTEGFGLPSLESGACGIAQIVLDHGASREIMGPGAIYVKVGAMLDTNIGQIGLADKVDLYRKMRFLQDVEQARNKIARYALKRSKLWTWENAVKKLEEELNS